MNVDWERINSFITEDDEEEKQWLREMVLSLISNYEERANELSELAKNPNQEKLVSLLHQIKGVTSNFGLENLRKIIANAELLAKANQITQAFSEIEKCPTIWIETKAELKEKLGMDS